MATEKRLIDANALMDEVLNHPKPYRRDFYRMLNDATTVDAVEVVHGRWLRDGDWLICLNCESEINVKNILGVDNQKNYCPNCGAKMDETVTDSHA